MTSCLLVTNPDSKVHGANMGPIWGQQDPGGSHVGPMNIAIWEAISKMLLYGEWDHLEHVSLKCESKYQTFASIKCVINGKMLFSGN